MIKMKNNCEECPYCYNNEYCIYHDIYLDDKECDLCGEGFRKELKVDYESQFDKIYQR